MKTARHIDRMPNLPKAPKAPSAIETHIGPRIVRMDYIDRILDQAAHEYRRAISLDDVDRGHEALRRYVVLRARARRAIERYRQQNGRAGKQIPDTGHGPEESEATSKFAGDEVAGNSGRNGRYVVTVGSPGGVVDERFYADFAAMVIGARDLTERYPHPERQIVCANWDRADVDSDGLSDAERELLEELLA